jgi:broad specificity phosphatase PhoE
MVVLRRDLVAAGIGVGWGIAKAAAPAPGRVLIVRHARTEPGVGDPPGYRLDQCASQRNLDDIGRKEARALGRQLASRGWVPRAIRSSRWCRCLETAHGVAAGFTDARVDAPVVHADAALDSFFEARANEPAQTAALRTRLAALPAPRGPRDFELWVTHAVNISALTGRDTAMGSGWWLLLAAPGRIEASPLMLS